jgi:phosphomannomutase
MRENSYDLGIAFDGDADRVVFVTSNGDILHGDQALFIFAEDILANNPSATIITEVKASIVLLDHIKKCGGRAFISKTGHSGDQS